MGRLPLLTILISLLFLTSLKAESEFMNIQWPDGRNNYFEGWYHRFVDREKGLSMVVISTAYNTVGVTRPGIKNGYLSLILKREGHPVILHQKKIDRVSLRVDDRNGYRLEVPNYGEVNDSGFNLEIEGIQLKASWSNADRLPWPTGRISGLDTPADLAAYFPLFPTHWHVHNMGGTANYQISSRDEEIEVSSSATFHHEKNWGQVFPYYWYWIDVMDPEQEVFISGAGGKVKLLGLDIPAFLLAIRTPVATLRINPLNRLSKYKIESDNCTTFTISGNDRNLSFELTLNDREENFFNLLIPTKEGYVPGALESVTAVATLKLWRRSPRGKKSLIGRYQVNQSALEFGNEAYKCD